MQLESGEDSEPTSRNDFIWLIRSNLAGRAGEQVLLGGEKATNTGAVEDYKTASRLAINMLSQFAFEKENLFTMPYDQLVKGGLLPEYAKEANKILLEQEKETRRLIEEGKEIIRQLAEALNKKSHLTADEIRKILE